MPKLGKICLICNLKDLAKSGIQIHIKVLPHIILEESIFDFRYARLYNIVIIPKEKMVEP